MKRSFGPGKLKTRRLSWLNRTIRCLKPKEDFIGNEYTYHGLFEELTDGVYVTKVDGAIVEVNQAFSDMFGYDKEKFKKLNVLRIYANPLDRRIFREKIDSQGLVKNYPAKLIKRDGTPIDCLITARVRRSSTGEIIGYRGIVRDVTEFKALQRQLIHAKKMESLTTLLGGIAHDFNNLLQVVIGYAEFTIMNKTLDSETEKNLAIIRNTAQGGADVVKRLLTFIQQDQHSQPVIMNLNQKIWELEHFLAKMLPSTIVMSTNLGDELKMIHADPSHIEQVIMNILVNAKEAMPDGGSIVVESENIEILDRFCPTCRRVITPGDYVVLKITDTGAGIEEKNIPRIFEPYYTTKQMDSRRGTGLGLSVVQGIVLNYNGHIECFSEMGKGTTFRIYFPAFTG